ncbi:UNVERIFIED_ORG: type I restriction enzyme S subunit [Leuconostoc holzapfelii]
MSEKTPQIRFKGFTDDWEECKLSSISERVTRRNKNNESTLPLTISAQDGLVDQNDFFNKQVASRDVTGYFLVKNGEFAYNKSYSNGYPWGAIKRLDKYDMGVLSTLYIVFRPTEINSQFLVSYYDTTRWYREVSKNAAEGARNHGLLNIAPTDFFNTLLVVPNTVDEQEKIGLFFKQLDNTIALHQRKLDLLKEQKKGFLQKMFPKNGAKVPELRFEEFTDDWEERKLKYVASYRNGKAHEQVEDENGKFTIVNSKFISTDGKVKRNTNEQVEPMFKGELAIVLSDLPNGKALAKVFLVNENEKYTLNQRIAGITPKENCDSKFLSYRMNRHSYFLKFDSGVSQTNLSKPQVEEFVTLYPSFEEQQKIGSFFKQLDDTIALHQRKLDLLKEQKKGFLQKMFI